jgi:hypothetical protein
MVTIVDTTPVTMKTMLAVAFGFGVGRNGRGRGWVRSPPLGWMGWVVPAVPVMPLFPGADDEGADVVRIGPTAGPMGASMLEEPPPSVGLAEGVNGDKVLWMTLGLSLRLGLVVD